MSFLSHGFGRLKDLADVPSTVGNEGKFLGLDGAGNPIWDTPAGGGGGFISSVTDTAEIDLDVTGSDLTATIIVDSIDQSKLEPGIRDLLTDADTALQLADLQIAPLETPTSSDLINFIDVSDSNNLKTATIGSLPGGGGSQEVYIQDTQPSVSAPTIWVQTGLGKGGNKFMLWALSA